MFKVFGALCGIITTLLCFWCVYLALWVMLVGGIVDIIDQIKAPTTDSQVVAIGIVKIIFCEMPFVLLYFFAIFGYGFTGVLLATKNK
jgi:hypothetical protein